LSKEIEEAGGIYAGQDHTDSDKMTKKLFGDIEND
jgi:hypothetical protein